MTGSTPNPMLHAALSYAHLGWPVLPTHYPTAKGCSCGKPDCGSPAKHPACEHGLDEATTDEQTIRRWWNNGDRWGIGVACEAGGLVVLDVDKHGNVDGEATFAELVTKLGPLPHTCEAFTGGGGRHLFFRHPGGELRGKLGPGLDVRATAYVLVEPSGHISGGRYSWERAPESCPPAELPEAWAEALRKPAVTASSSPSPATKAAPAVLDRARAYLHRMDAAISGQGGHDACFRAACAMAWGFDLCESDVRALLKTDYNDRCEPPWSDKELEHKAKQAAAQTSDPQNRPRGHLRDAEPPRLHGTSNERPQSDVSGHSAQPEADKDPVLTVEQLWPEFSDELKRRARGVPAVSTTIPGLDRLLGGGLQGGCVSRLCAPPARNKTSTAVLIGTEHARSGSRAVIWSRELPTSHVLARMVSQSTGAPWVKVLAGCCPEDVERTGGELAGLELFVDDTPKAERIEPLLHQTPLGGRPTLLVVDYLQALAKSHGSDPRQGVEIVSAWLLELAKRTGAAVLAISSTSRAAYSIGENGVAEIDRVLAMARDSGQLEFDAAAVLGLISVRPKGATDGPERYQKGLVVLAKNRFGATGRVAVELDGQAGTIREIDSAELTPPNEGLSDLELEATILSLVGDQELTTRKEIQDRIKAKRTRVLDAVTRLLAANKLTGGGKNKPFKRTSDAPESQS